MEEGFYRLTEPVVHPQIRDAVPHQQVEPAVVGSDIVQSSAHEKQAQVTQRDELGVLGLVQRARRVEVVDTAEPAVGLALAAALGLLLVVVVAGNVGEQVHGPAKQLLQDEVRGGQNGSVLHELTELVNGLAHARGILITGLGNEHHVAGQVTGGLVVLAVGDLPREVWNKQERVADPPHSVVQDLGRRESLVAALVGQHPDTGTKQTLNNGVQCPKGNTGRH